MNLFLVIYHAIGPVGLALCWLASGFLGLFFWTKPENRPFLRFAEIRTCSLGGLITWVAGLWLAIDTQGRMHYR